MADPARTVDPAAAPATNSHADPEATTGGILPDRTDSPVLAPDAGRYVLGDEIAHGGMGVVYRATDTALGREVAVKVLKDKFGPQSGVARRFADEARIAAQLQHPGIPPVHDLGTLPDGRPFLAMKLIKGQTLDELLTARPDVSADRGRFVAVFESMCQAVAYAHAHKVIHRDLKPANVMVGAFGEVQVMDWGLAKVLGSQPNEATDRDETSAGTEVVSLRDSDGSFTQAGSVLGTPAFMPPEQAVGAIGKVDARSDVFGLGAVLVVILTGKPPFVGVSAETTRIQAAQGKVDECFARLDACGAEPELVALCKRCLSPTPTDRPADAQEVAEAVARLRAAADERARQAELDKVRGSERRKRRRVQLVLAGTALGLVAAAGFGVLLASLWQRAERAKGSAETAQSEAEAARERLAAVEYGRTMQVAYREWLDNNAAATVALLASTRPDLRGWEYDYLNGLCHTELLTLKGHTRDVTSVEYSPDGSRIVTGSPDGTVRIWDAATGAQRSVFNVPPEVLDITSFSPDGSRVLATGQMGFVRVWDAGTGTELVSRTYDFDQAKMNGVLRSWFSPDGTRLVTEDYEGHFNVVDAKSGAKIVSLDGHNDPHGKQGEYLVYSSCVFSRDGSKFVACGQATIGWGGTVRVWDTTTGAALLNLKELDVGVNTAAFSPDALRLVIGGLDRKAGEGAARVLDAKSGTQLLALKGHRRAIWTSSYSPDGSRIVTGCRDGTIQVWDAKSGSEMLVIRGHAGGIHSATFSPDGTRILSASEDGTARVWDAKTGAEVPPFTGHRSSINIGTFRQPGSQVVTIDEGGSVRVWNANTGKEVDAWRCDSVQGDSPIIRTALSPNGAVIATGHRDGNIILRDTRSKANFQALPVKSTDTDSVTLSSDGSLLAISTSVLISAKDQSFDYALRVWDTKTGGELSSLSKQQRITSVAFSPDGTRLLTTNISFDAVRNDSAGTAQVRDARTGAELLVIPLVSARTSSSAFSLDNSRFITGGNDGTVQVWDAKTGIELLVLRGHVGPVICVGFSPDGSRIITGGYDATARIWDARTGVEVMTLKGHIGYLSAASYSPDGRWVLTASGDGTARVWGVRSINRESRPPEPAPPPRAAK